MRLICKDCNKKYHKGPEIWVILTLKNALGIKEIFCLCPNCIVEYGQVYQIQDYLKAL